METDFLQIYSDEMKRMLWSKSAMDITRNLSVAILFGMIFVSFGFSEATSHRVSYFGSLAVFALVIFETRVFRYFAESEYRIQLMERNFIAPMFNKEIIPEKGWDQQLSQSYATSSKPPFIESIAFRIYKNYFILFLSLDTCWLSKIYLAPQPATSFEEFVHRLDLGFFLGTYTLAFMAVFWILFIVAAIWVSKKKKSNPRFSGY